MKSRNVTTNGVWRKTFQSGSVLLESRQFLLEFVSASPVRRVDPIFKKLKGPHSYIVSNAMALCMDDENPAEWNYKQTTISSNVVALRTTGCSGIVIPDPTASEQDTSAVANQALGRLNDSVRGNLDLSIALAESGKTAQMISRVGKVLSFARAHRPKGGYVIPGPLRFVNDASYALANGYLEYKYGWKQLMSDVFATADESIRFTLNQLQKFKASAKVDLSRQKTIPVTLEGLSGIPMSVEYGKKSKACARYDLVLKIPNSSFDIARWTSLNPLSLGWELIPYSFVVDWFLDVGSYLRNTETALYYNTQFSSGSLSTLVRIPMEGKITYFTQNVAGARLEVQALSGFKTFIHFDRTVLTKYPTPSLPRFTADLGASQMTSAASLLRQLLRRV